MTLNKALSVRHLDVLSCRVALLITVWYEERCDNVVSWWIEYVLVAVKTANFFASQKVIMYERILCFELYKVVYKHPFQTNLIYLRLIIIKAWNWQFDRTPVQDEILARIAFCELLRGYLYYSTVSTHHNDKALSHVHMDVCRLLLEFRIA